MWKPLSVYCLNLRCAGGSGSGLVEPLPTEHKSLNEKEKSRASPVILATQEAEIRRIVVCSQPWKKPITK
jgi:hypothetical protein